MDAEEADEWRRRGEGVEEAGVGPPGQLVGPPCGFERGLGIAQGLDAGRHSVARNRLKRRLNSSGFSIIKK